MNGTKNNMLSRPRCLSRLWFDWREGPWFAQGKAVGTVPHQVQAGAGRSPRGWCQGLLLVSENWACLGSDPLGCVQHAGCSSSPTAWEWHVCTVVVALPLSPLPQVDAVLQGTMCSLHLLVCICYSHLDIQLGWLCPCVKFWSAKPVMWDRNNVVLLCLKAVLWMGFSIRTFDGEPWPWAIHVV